MRVAVGRVREVRAGQRRRSTRRRRHAVRHNPGRALSWNVCHVVLLGPAEMEDAMDARPWSQWSTNRASARVRHCPDALIGNLYGCQNALAASSALCAVGLSLPSALSSGRVREDDEVASQSRESRTYTVASFTTQLFTFLYVGVGSAQRIHEVAPRPIWTIRHAHRLGRAS